MDGRWPLSVLDLSAHGSFCERPPHHIELKKRPPHSLDQRSIQSYLWRSEPVEAGQCSVAWHVSGRSTLAEEASNKKASRQKGHKNKNSEIIWQGQRRKRRRARALLDVAFACGLIESVLQVGNARWLD